MSFLRFRPPEVDLDDPVFRARCEALDIPERDLIAIAGGLYAIAETGPARSSRRPDGDYVVLVRRSPGSDKFLIHFEMDDTKVIAKDVQRQENDA